MQRSRKLNHAEQWLRDGLEVTRPPAFFQLIEVDMSRPQALLETARHHGIRLTFSHILVRATALALARNPELHVVMAGNRVFFPSQVDIGLSVAGDSFVAPILVLEGADHKDLLTLGREIIERAPEVRAADQRLMQNLRQWGWIIPFSIVRRALLRVLFRFVQFRRKGAGTFQVTLLHSVDHYFAPMFSTCGILTAGRVRDSVIPVNGEPVIRPVITLTCGADHRVWDGRASERILLAIRDILEKGELDDELAAAIDLGAEGAAQQA